VEVESEVVRCEVVRCVVVRAVASEMDCCRRARLEAIGAGKSLPR
jgi:hypothetical protein